METINILKKRRSIRKYSNKPISKGILKDIVDCGRLAPSDNNSQPWHFLVITEKEELKFISNKATYGEFIKEAAACVIVFCEKNNRHHLEDGAAATENMIIAASSYGIGTCWVAGYNRIYEEDLKEQFKVPRNLKMISIISMGYPGEEPYKQKKPLKEVLYWETF